MKKKLAAVLLSVTTLLGVISQSAYVVEASKEESSVGSIKVTNSSYEDIEGYDEAFKVNGIESYSNNGGKYGSSVLERAFDGDTATHWETGKPNSETFINEVVITFEEIEEINRILYTPRKGNKGHVTALSIWGSMEESGDAFEKIAMGDVAIYSGWSEFRFDTTSFKRLKFVFDAANQEWAAAGEFQFYKEDVVMDRVEDIFTDGTMSALKEQYQFKEILDELAQQVVGHPNEETLKKRLETAYQVYENPEYYTQQVTTIAQEGKVRSYANSVQYNRFAQMIQPTGIVAKPGETITIYLDIDDNAPAPTVMFSQHEASWRKWGNSFQLKKGVNVIEVPAIDISEYSVKTVAGGAIYFSNTYTEDEQGSIPKVRIEGGQTFPLYTEEIGKEQFMDRLEVYMEQINEDPENTVDIVEVRVEHLLFTGQASGAYKALTEGGNDIEEVAAFWETFMEEILEYGGLDNSEEIHSREGQYGTVRLMQPYGALYAHNTHVGVQRAFMDYFFTPSRIMEGSWGIVHEFGHQLDYPAATWGEVTNNMWSNKIAMEYADFDRVKYETIFRYTASDVETETGYDQYGYFDRLGMFWQLEIAFEDFWTNLQKMYRKEAPTVTDQEHKRATFVEYASKVVGYDLTEHFKKYNFIEQDVVVDAISHLPKIDKKLWYLHKEAYEYDGIGFTEEVVANIVGIKRGTDRNTLTLTSKKSQASELLGYEVLRDGEVIGFTSSNEFVDYDVEEGINYVYTAKAVDKALNISEESVEVQSLRPELFVHDIMLPLYEELDPMNQVQAHDYLGNEITHLVQVNHNVDTNTRGAYPVTYQVTDENGYTTVEEMTVYVGSAITYLSDLEEVSFKVGYSTFRKDLAPNGGAITFKQYGSDVVFEKGLGLHADSEIIYDLTQGEYSHFEAKVGIDQSAPNGTRASAKFAVYLDGELAYETGTKLYNDTWEQVAVDITGAKELKLVTNGLGNTAADHTVWADAKLLVKDAKPTLQVPATWFIEKGTSFAPLMGAIAMDAEDGDITHKIQVSGWVNGDRLGAYDLVYKVKDSDGNKVEVAKTVYVVEKENATYMTYLSDVDYKSVKLGYGTLGIDVAPSGNVIRLTDENGNEALYEKGLGLHAIGEVTYDLTDKDAYRFTAYVGIDRSMYYSVGSVGFEVWLDGVKVEETEVKYGKDSQSFIDVDITGAKELKLRVNDGGNGIGSDHGAWGDAKLHCIDTTIQEPQPEVDPFDRTLLKAALDLADTKVESEYEVAAWEAFVEMRDIAREVYEDSNTCQEEINSMQIFLEQEMKYLEQARLPEVAPEPEVPEDEEDLFDRTKLKAAIDIALTKVESDYELAAWEAFVEMRDMAIEVYEDKNTFQGEINSMQLFLEQEMRCLEQARVTEV